MSDPRAYLVVFGDKLEHECVMTDRAHAEGYAAQSHGMCMRLYLSEEDAAVLRSRQEAQSKTPLFGALAASLP